MLGATAPFTLGVDKQYQHATELAALVADCGLRPALVQRVALSASEGDSDWRCPGYSGNRE